MKNVRGGFPPEELEGGNHGMAEGNWPGQLQPQDSRWTGRPAAEFPAWKA